MDERLGLLNELRAGRCTVSIITTYSVDFHFYEAVILRKLNAAGCEHHILLVDAERCGEALADPDRRPRLAGISYVLLPVARAGAFHPKLILLAGKKSSRLFVGSHNATFPGFGGNAEITNVVGGTQSPDEGAALLDALTAVRAWASEVPTTLPDEILDLAGRLLGSAKPQATAEASLLYSTIGRPSLWDQLQSYIPKKPRRVVVVGPFFDDGMQFIRRAMSDLRASEFIVAIDPAYSVLNPTEARKTTARFVDARGCLERVGFADSSSLHAKMLLIEGNDRTLLVSGSANPSSAAWLKTDVNAEAIIVRNDVPEADLKRLGLLDLPDAPEITATQWAELEERTRAEGNDQPSRAGHALVAVEADGRITIYGAVGPPKGVRLLFGDGHRDDSAEHAYEHDTIVVGGPRDLSTCSIVEVVGNPSGFAVVNHSAVLSPQRGGSGARSELRAALGGVTEDPARIEEVLKIVERAIEEVDGLDALAGAGGTAHEVTNETDAAPLGSRAIKLDDVRRRHGRPKSLASGDIAVVIDLLIRRIAEGLPPREVAPSPREVEESELDPLEEAARAASIAFDADALLKACHRKLRRMVRRMVERLDHVMGNKAGGVRATIQLAAVLGVLRWLRRLERQLPWLPFGESLIPEEARNDLFWSCATYLGVSRPSLIELVKSETGEASEELTIAVGLASWLGREAGIDVRSLARHPDEDDLAEFHWVGLLVMLMRHVAFDDEATTTLKAAVAEGRGADREAWLTVHLRIGKAAALAETSPGESPAAGREVRRGDLVRIDMPNGKVDLGFVVELDGAKVRLLDTEHEDGRPVLKKFVTPLDLDAIA